MVRKVCGNNHTRTVTVTISAPASKSYAQRALVASLLAGGVTTISGITLCDDVAAVINILKAFGCNVSSHGLSTIVVDSSVIKPPSTICVGESALAARIFMCVAALYENPIKITCTGSLYNRSMDMVVKPLMELGVTVNGGEAPYALPLTVCGRIVGSDGSDGLADGSGGVVDESYVSDGLVVDCDGSENFAVESVGSNGSVELAVDGSENFADGSNGSVELAVDAGGSSQGITGLLMTLPMVVGDTSLTIKNLTSTPYIDMTLEVIRKFGVKISNKKFNNFQIAGSQRYVPTDISLEGDWSSMSLFLVLGALRGDVVINNLNVNSLQGDKVILDVLTEVGAIVESGEKFVKVSKPATRLRKFNFDATDFPDLFPALVVLAANCEGISIVNGVSRLHNKESDRAQSLQNIFGTMGVKIDFPNPDAMRVYGGEIHDSEVDSYGDHRIAMAAAVAAIGGERCVTINNSQVVNKSYPQFWHDLALFE